MCHLDGEQSNVFCNQYLSRFGTHYWLTLEVEHYWLTLEVEHYYTTITSEGSDVPSLTTELHVVGIDNQSRTHDLRTEIYNGEQGINLQNEVYQSQIGKKEIYFCMTYHLVQEDCSTDSMSDSDRLKVVEHFYNSTRN